MPTNDWKMILSAAVFALTPQLVWAQPLAKPPEFDVTLEIRPTSSKAVKIEKPGPARNFERHIAAYIRFVPAKGNRAFPVFITEGPRGTYLTCEGSDTTYKLLRASRVDFDKPTGSIILGLFFEHAPCEKPTLHLDAITEES